MKTQTIKSGTKEEILEYLMTNGKNYTWNRKELSKWIDDQVSRGHNMICLDELSISIPCGVGSSVESAPEKFILEDFRKQYMEQWTEKLCDIPDRAHFVDCWEQVIKIEREAEKRDQEYIYMMALLKFQIEKLKVPFYKTQNGIEAFW